MNSKTPKEYWFPNDSLACKVDQRESDNSSDDSSSLPLSNHNITSFFFNENDIYAVTINPNPNKRISLPVNGKKSICRQYKNYTNAEQEIILLALLEPVRHLTKGHICFENTQNHNRHLHTIFYVRKDFAYASETENLAKYTSIVRERCTDKKGVYTCMDIKTLDTEADYTRWMEYIYKTYNSPAGKK